MVDLTITGIQEAQRANLRMIENLRLKGIPAGVRAAGLYLHRAAVVVTHVITGSLRASHRFDMTWRAGDAEGMIYIDPASINPRTKNLPADYGIIEHERGGTHAFYARAYSQRRTAAELGVREIKAAL